MRSSNREIVILKNKMLSRIRLDLVTRNTELKE